ncbi:unnamed protein product [Vicia faba]|uniref:Protein ENHANCED DISEASE RESISTANCE 2 C-terminal domain-containing protein n=1 Tax=Vicia faba TaxID=3906 RepID=A0AAV1A8W4_VICFA|nr:unnamed protein product [Vicia faba]
MCNYHRGSNYLEVDVDIGSSAIANAILHLALGYVTSVTIDMGFFVEAHTKDELPERLIDAAKMMLATVVVDSLHAPMLVACGIELAKVNHRKSKDEDESNF